MTYILIIVTLSGDVITREECSHEVITLKCEALKQVKQIGLLTWKVNDSHTNKYLTKIADCDKTLRWCGVMNESIEHLIEEHGITVSVSNGSLSIKRSSRKTASGSVEFSCEVEDQAPWAAGLIQTKFHLSWLECKFSDIIFLLKHRRVWFRHFSRF